MKNYLKRRLVALGLLFSMTINMSGCKVKDKSDSDSSFESVVSEVEDSFVSSTENSISQVERLLIVNEYINQLDSICSTYPYREYYLTRDEVSSIVNTANNTMGCSNTDGFISNTTINNLTSVIYDNSIKYAQENSSADIFNPIKTEFAYEDKIINIDEVINTCLHRVFDNATNDVGEDLCYLSNIKIVISESKMDDGAMGLFLPEQNIIYIFRDAILENAKEGSTIKDVLYLTICHELEHARQIMCQHRRTTDSYTDIRYSEFVTSLIESSAESSLYNLKIDPYYKEKDAFDYTYYSERSGESLLLLLGITNNSVNEYYNAIFDTDLKALFQYFHLEEIEDIETFYRILFAIDIKNGRSPLLGQVFDKDIFTVGELEKIAGYGYRVDIFKLTLQSMINFTYQNRDFTLEENLMIFDIIKNLIVSDAYKFEKNGDDYEYVYDPDFAYAINSLETIYASFLCDYYKVSLEDIRALENDFILKDVFDEFTYGNNPKALYLNSKLFQRFSVLRAIVFVNPVFYYNYSRFLDNNDFSLELKIKN